MMIEFAVNYFKDGSAPGERVLSHSYGERWAKEESLFCPGCGTKSVWCDQGGGDYYVGAQHLCLACEHSFYLPSGVGLAANEQDQQRLAALRKEAPA